jgi:tetratricopeptide (TPR) repeat protein
MPRTSLVLSIAALLLTACSQFSKLANDGQSDASSPLSYSEAQKRYQQGFAKYRNSHFDAALADLGAAASSGQLNLAETVNARKHMAFIHCAAGRELPCREQFQTILKIEPNFNLAANEAGHPAWGPVWRSIKGAAEERRAVAQAASIMASAAQQKLAEGIREYDAGNYKEALEALQAAIKSGLPGRTEEIRAHKYSAFIYCLTQRATLCRSEFRSIFAVDPAFELLPSESGHPAWASSYRKEKAAASRQARKRAGG